MTNQREKLDRNEEVSGAYRSLAAETVPEHLNRQVLSMAAGGSGSKVRSGFASVFWMRPVAWAATVGLCLAIVLEVTEDPVSNVKNKPAAAVESLREEFIPKDSDTLNEARERARLQAGSNLQEKVESAPEPSRDDTLPEASRKTAKRLPASAAMSLEVAQFESATYCDPNERRSAKEWLLCIKKLRDSGYEEEADQEYEAFALQYPAESSPLEPNK